MMSITRRDFLKQAAMGTASVAIGPGWLRAARSSGDTVVVVLNFFGGNDGLNTVIPLNQYSRYRDLRPAIGIAEADLLTLSGTSAIALTPGLSSLRDLYNDGVVAVLCGVGLPPDANGLFDHAASQYIFQTCDPARAVSTAPPSGWLGRYLDGVSGTLVTPGIDMGGGRLMVTGKSFTPVSITTIDEFRLLLSFDADARMAAYRRIMNVPESDAAAELNRRLRLEALPQCNIIESRTKDYVPAVTYPEDSYLASQLLDCAKLINADIGIRVLAVGKGDFDTHSGQNDGQGAGQLGFHDRDLKEIGDSISAFYRDLDAHGQADRVLILTISEFGRRAYENNDQGTDHGYGSTFFAIGKPVRGGVYGDYPDLSESALVLDGNLDVTVDVRSVYATIAARYLGADPALVTGGNFEQLDFL